MKNLNYWAALAAFVAGGFLGYLLGIGSCY